MRAVDCAYFAPPTQRTRRDDLVHGRSVLLPVARDGDDYAFVPPAALPGSIQKHAHVAFFPLASLLGCGGQVGKRWTRATVLAKDLRL